MGTCNVHGLPHFYSPPPSSCSPSPPSTLVCRNFIAVVKIVIIIIYLTESPHSPFLVFRICAIVCPCTLIAFVYGVRQQRTNHSTLARDHPNDYRRCCCHFRRAWMPLMDVTHSISAPPASPENVNPTVRNIIWFPQMGVGCAQSSSSSATRFFRFQFILLNHTYI